MASLATSGEGQALEAGWSSRVVFSSPVFLFLFLPLVLAVEVLLPRQAKNLALLLASVAFYAWGEHLFFLVMLASIFTNWIIGLAIERLNSQRWRFCIILIAAIFNISLLIYFKYSFFILDNINSLIEPFGFHLQATTQHLPLGISFFTFHALSYIIDVYRRDATAQTNPIDFALYIAFFPQLVAGPIVRYHDIFKQLKERRFRLDIVASGIERFIAGLGKKMLLANPLGEVADGIFSLTPDRLTTQLAWIGIAAYSLQIYLDFSAYSDMAIGLARMFSLNFLENFNYPYRARSVRDFWQRWHISLTNFFRDYFYIPLGGNRVSEWRVWFNQILVFLVCGLWHGAAWTFLFWGALHGLFLCLERTAWGRTVERLPTPLAHMYVMSIVCVAWVLFRSSDLTSAIHYLSAMVSPYQGADAASTWEFVDRQFIFTFAVAIPVTLGLFSCLTSDWTLRANQRRGELHPSVYELDYTQASPLSLFTRISILSVIFWLSAAKIAAGTYNPFIYFRF